MYFVVIKLRYILLLMAVVGCVMVCAKIDSSAPAFSVGGREIPIYSVERDDKKIALTFDCAWNADDIDKILDALDMYNAKATFFVVGDWAKEYSGALEKIYSRGHQIGTHSMSHKDYTTLTKEEILRDINACEDTVMNITDDRPILVRAPSGAYNDTVIQSCEESHRIYIQWSVDGLDYTDDATEDSIYNRVVEKTGAGDIILLHNGTKFTAGALPKILCTLSQDYEFSTVYDMIYTDNFTIDASGRQHLIK